MVPEDAVNSTCLPTSHGPVFKTIGRTNDKLEKERLSACDYCRNLYKTWCYFFISRLCAMHYSAPAKRGKILERVEVCVGEEKVFRWSTKAAISIKRAQRQNKLLWWAFRNSPMLFRKVPCQTPYGLLFPRFGIRNPRLKLQSKISVKRLLTEG